MRKLAVFLIMCVLLSGCREKVWETISDQIMEEPREPAQLVHFAVPSGASQTVLSDEQGNAVYFCNGYTICQIVRPAGNLRATICEMTGLDMDALTVMKTQIGDVICYDCAWTCAGENGQKVCRGEILDDGNYHYSLSVFSEDEDVSDYLDVWQSLFDSFSLEEYSAATS